jgi:hypothetical protein
MARVALFHWNAAEAADRIERLRHAGFETEYFPDTDRSSFQRIRENPPEAVVIDLSRQPSHGRELGIYLRGQKATRRAALVFIEGDPEKTAQVRSLLPDAVYTTWPRIAMAVKRAIKLRPERPVVPGTFAGYSGTPLPKKLRIVEDSVVALVGAPEGFPGKLEPLPDGVKLQTSTREATVILAFFESAGQLDWKLPGLAAEMRQGRTLWLIWPKKTSGIATDLSEKLIRESGLATGLVDYKICAVDETWSGLAFAARKAKAADARR